MGGTVSDTPACPPHERAGRNVVERSRSRRGTSGAHAHFVSPPLSKRIPVGVLVALGITLALACNNGHDEEDDDQYREEVIWCEEAAARLEACCGSAFDVRGIECPYYYSYDSGCSGSRSRLIEPAFTSEESRCIRDTSCEAIVANGICKRAQAAGKARTEETSSIDPIANSSTSGSVKTGPVCP